MATEHSNRSIAAQHPFDGAKIIYAYTRAQAIEDGVLVDLSAMATDVCRSHFKFPVACTSAVWAIIDKAVKNRRHCNDLNGVIHDLLSMSRKNVRSVVSESILIFQVNIKGAGSRRLYTFKIVCGPGDNAEPVLTIMLPKED